jgi:hypothetical protein
MQHTHSIGLEGVALTRHKRHARRTPLYTEAWMASFSFWSRASPDRETYVRKSAVVSKLESKKTAAAGRGKVHARPAASTA